MVSAGGSQGQKWKDHLSPSSREGMCRFQGQPGRAQPSLPPAVPFLFLWVERALVWCWKTAPASLRCLSKKKTRKRAAVAQSRAQLCTLFYQYCCGNCDFSVNCDFILKYLLVFSPVLEWDREKGAAWVDLIFLLGFKPAYTPTWKSRWFHSVWFWLISCSLVYFLSFTWAVHCSYFIGANSTSIQHNEGTADKKMSGGGCDRMGV